MNKPRRVLSLFDTVSIIVGIVIGAGIFRLPSLVASQLGGEAAILTAWAAGGLISIVGALCIAELATAYPHPGGEYHFLTRAYGRDCGFMFAWARMTVVQTGSIALLAYIFGDYAAQLLPLGPHGTSLYAVAAILFLTAVNLIGIRQTKLVQNLLFAATILGLLCVIGGAFLTPAAPAGRASAPAATPSGVGLAMIFILLTYGGWNEAAYVSAEVKDGPRNMVRGLLLGLGVITLFYVAVNFAYLRVLGVSGVAGSKALASDFMRGIFGEAGVVFMSFLILAIVLASLNVTVLTGARTNFALGRDFPAFGFLSHWSSGGGAPVRALLVQGAIALTLVLLGAFSRRNIELVVDYLSPVFWLFFLLTAISLFVLRRREPGAERPFRVPLYPVTPALFCLTSAYLLYSSLNYTGAGALVGVGVLILGIPFLAWARRRPAPAETTTAA
ncbi:MAG: amino acid permease [Candidatus Tectomicrobia bacterium]|uniref:Amino acid permease n=1 Tax=Tectimicrobiota bacterium TaxID=2528274 RepID=A0A932I0P3_UNCTE|nr:amino acid permease [Candidatus Tectomicrobia bacterium]